MICKFAEPGTLLYGVLVASVAFVFAMAVYHFLMEVIEWTRK